MRNIYGRRALNVIFSVLYYLLLIANGSASAQSVDTTSTYRIVNPEQQKFIRARDHVAITTAKLQFSIVENQIIALESEECNALLKRDTIVLRRIWARDYSFDEQITGLANGKNALPYYTVMNRIVEKINPTDSVVFTSGIEYVQMLNTVEKLSDVTKRTFFHTWRKNYGVWKLTTNIHE
jgi:hypothetical protein